MAKDIGILILSIAITAIGIISFNRLHYWERSVRIFNTNNEQFIRRGFDRQRGNFADRERRGRFESSGNRFERQDFRNLPDSVRQGIFAERSSTIPPDSLREHRLSVFPAERENFRNRSFDQGGRHGRGNFRQGNQIQLGNVTWFFAVFALFTVVTIYIDKGYKLIRRKNKDKNTTYPVYKNRTLNV